ncbi:MAG: hypothetical protein II263_03235, partial [Lachnospiraceae bacterium]|nr:hypothetical protein [Lachnospiraceae bacterium]
RSDLLFNLEAIQAYGAKIQKDVGSGQTDLFGMMGAAGEVPEVAHFRHLLHPLLILARYVS